jgi:hypothetical protein
MTYPFDLVNVTSEPTKEMSFISHILRYASDLPPVTPKIDNDRQTFKKKGEVSKK